LFDKIRQTIERQNVVKKSLFIIVALFFVQISNAQTNSMNYLGQSPPGEIPIVFASGVVSVENKNTHALNFSPDGKTIIFSRYPDKTSYIMTFENGKWSEPVESFFHGKEVSFSKDGNKIFYYTGGGDIFFVEKKDANWSEPVKMGKNINTAETEYYPSIVNDGSIYFSRDGNWKTGRVMYSKFIDGNYSAAVDLGLPINNGGALHAWISPDESYMLFNSPRVGSFTQNDIWVSFRKSDGTWTNPKNLGEKINSSADAILCPTVSPDGKYMFFTKLNFSTKAGYIYWVSTKFLNGLMEK
jgi:Tol biopolymer transport system component